MLSCPSHHTHLHLESSVTAPASCGHLLLFPASSALLLCWLLQLNGFLPAGQAGHFEPLGFTALGLSAGKSWLLIGFESAKKGRDTSGQRDCFSKEDKVAEKHLDLRGTHRYPDGGWLEEGKRRRRMEGGGRATELLSTS